MIENPAVQFTLDAKAGEYDEVSDETYNFLLNEVEELSKFWCDQKEVPAVQILGAIFRKMNLDQNTIGAVSERLQNEKEKKDNIVKIIVAVVIIYLICYIIGGEVEWLARTAIIWTGIVLAIRGIRKKN